MKESQPNSVNYNEANFQADDVVDNLIGTEIARHINCNCHQCKLRAKQLAEDWLYGVDPQVIAEWYNSQ